eukprot:gene2545-3297_t
MATDSTKKNELVSEEYERLSDDDNEVAPTDKRRADDDKREINEKDQEKVLGQVLLIKKLTTIVEKDPRNMLVLIENAFLQGNDPLAGPGALTERDHLEGAHDPVSGNVFLKVKEVPNTKTTPSRRKENWKTESLSSGRTAVTGVLHARSGRASGMNGPRGPAGVIMADPPVTAEPLEDVLSREEAATDLSRVDGKEGGRKEAAPDVIRVGSKEGGRKEAVPDLSRVGGKEGGRKEAATDVSREDPERDSRRNYGNRGDDGSRRLRDGREGRFQLERNERNDRDRIERNDRDRNDRDRNDRDRNDRDRNDRGEGFARGKFDDLDARRKAQMEKLEAMLA